MLFKVAVRNIRRSVKDYAIYFVTLLVAITIFYAFNSVSDQQVMTELAQSSKTNIVEFTAMMMGIFSTVVALVLGFLVIYANQLLIRRRKHEFGMYFTLGMTPGHVSRIILYETVLVGFVSLVLGLVLGVLVSQLLSFATAALFGIPMPDYQFSFSMHAFVMTLVCVVAIYLVVAVFNVISIRRCKLIDLLNADAKNQKVAIRNPWICLALFVVSIGMIAAAYWFLQQNGMTLIADDDFNRATVLMLLGTLLLFFSLSGFIIAVVTRIRGFYLKKLRPFTTRQVASKVNTSFASVWIVCVLLFFAITTFGTGMALVDWFVGDIDRANPYDATVISMQEMAEADAEKDGGAVFPISDTEDYLREHIDDWDKVVKGSAQLTIYSLPGVTYGDVMDATGATVDSNTIRSVNVGVVGLSQYNAAMALQGEASLELDDSQYAVTNNQSISEELANAIADQGYTLETPGGKLDPLQEVQVVQLEDFSMLSNGVTIVVPDSVIDQVAAMPGTLDVSYVNVMYQPGMEAKAETIFDHDTMETVPGMTQTISREQMIEQAMGMRMLITYLALYIGLVLLVATAAVLAIQLLSLTIDSLGRYRTLSRLGCDTRMISASLFAQVIIYFLMPLAVAVCHSAWAIHILGESLFSAFSVDITPSLFMSAGLVLIVYGGYLVITYLAARATVRSGLKQSA